MAIYFTFASSSPQILQAIPTGAIFTEVVVAVETPFNTPASCLVGVAANPGLFLGSSDSDLTQVGQYESDVLVSIPTIELLILTLNAGGATLGSGVVFYRYLNP